MMGSLQRTWVIAHNFLLEALRQKALNLIMLFGLVCVGSANAFTGFTFEDQIKFVKDFSFGAMAIFGLLLGVLGAAQMFQREIEQRTIYTVLSKPVRRAEFLWGKFVGLASLLVLALLLMTAVFVVVLVIKEHTLVAAELAQEDGAPSDLTQEAVRKIHEQIRDPQMIQAWLLLVAKLLLTAGLATLVATVATSTLFTVAMTLLIYLIGHLQSIAREMWWQSESTSFAVQKVFAGVLAILVPDFSAFNLLDDLLAGQAVAWSHTLGLLGYTGLYLLVLLLVSQLIFQEREL